MMEKYILAITREAQQRKQVSIDEFVEAVRGIPSIEVPDSFGKRVQVQYPGTMEELRDCLGEYSPYVHIEKAVEHKFL